MQPRFHVLAAIGCAWAAGLLLIVSFAWLRGDFALSHETLFGRLLMLAIFLLLFTCFTVLIGGLTGLAVLWLLRLLRLLQFYHFLIAALLLGSTLAAACSVVFLVCVSEPGPRSFASEFAFTLPLALVMSVAGFVSYWLLSRDRASKA